MAPSGFLQENEKITKVAFKNPFSHLPFNQGQVTRLWSSVDLWHSKCSCVIIFSRGKKNQELCANHISRIYFVVF